MPHHQYNNSFDINFESENASEKNKKAYEEASDIRKFEIELYWKRSGYFWTMLTVVFAGYFSVLSAEHCSDKYLLSFIIACVGSVFTFAWCLANKGSKYWQENWENHVDLLEDKITGPLYKTRLERPREDCSIETFITSPSAFSVSKINMWVNVFVLFIWIFLLYYSAFGPFDINRDSLCVFGADWLKIIIFVLSLWFCTRMLDSGRSNQKTNNLSMFVRKVNISMKKNTD